MPPPSPDEAGPSVPSPTSLVTDKRLRDVCRLTLAVVRAGEGEEPPVPAPPALHKVLGFQRLSGTAYEMVARAVDDDPELRARVAEAATEELVGRPGWLWLQRPEGWATDPAWLVDDTPTDASGGAASPDATKRSRVKAKARAETELARQRREADEARAGQRTARQELAAARRELAAVRDETAELAARLATVTDERNQAVRTAKGTEADLAESRRRLKLVKAAAIDAETELSALRTASMSSSEPALSASPSVSVPALAPVPPAPSIDAAAASSAVALAATAAADLGAALARAASALEPTVPQQPMGAGRGEEPRSPPPGERRARSTGRRRRVHRAVAPLPPGIFDGTPEAHRHLISGGDALLMVDGYNVARTAWSGLSPREDRERLVTLLESVQARSGGDVIVVFDGESGTIAPGHSRAIRVLFSATGVTADDHIAELVGCLPAERSVVVVSSDRAVIADAERHGATALSSPAFLTAARR